VAAGPYVTKNLRAAFTQTAKSNKGKISDEVIATSGRGRFSPGRTLTGRVLPDPGEEVDRRQLRPAGLSDGSRLSFLHVQALSGFSCDKNVAVAAPSGCRELRDRAILINLSRWQKGG
jgi:hypothetical protein